METGNRIARLWLLLYPFIYLKLIVLKLRAMFWCEYLPRYPFFKPVLATCRTYNKKIYYFEYWIKYVNPKWNDDFELEFIYCRPEILYHPVFDESQVPKIKRKSK